VKRFFYFFVCVLSLKLHALTYIPKNLDPKTADIVVVLHGCLQSPDAMRASTGFDQIAEERNWIVIYPRAPWGHPLGCWSWYSTANQKPGSGELQQIVDELEEARAKYEIGGQAFVTGISSGGTTVAGLMACYPELFAAAAIHSAPAYASASSGSEALAVMEKGPSVIKSGQAPCKMSDFKGRTLVLQGTADRIVHPAHADHIIASVLESGKYRIQKTAGHEGGLDFESTRYIQGRKTVAEVVKIDGLGHAWSGAKSSAYSYFETKGPNAALLMSEFFKPSKPQGHAGRGGPSRARTDCSKLVEK
jgi:poly(hydroxyalkanoate) depolymerase family esterase